MFLLVGFFADSLEYLTEWFTRFHYLAPFTVLMLCGLGLPLPEEITLIGCGLLVAQKNVGFWEITAVCSFAILLGDSIPFWLGRRYGLAALKSKLVARVLHPERFAQLERKFSDNGNWAIFTCRFLPGLRIPGYFTAGTLGMSYVRFLVLDSIGVLVSVPTSIWVAHVFFEKFGHHLEGAAKAVSEFNHIVLIGVAAVVLGIFVWKRIRKRRALAAAPVAPSAGAPAAQPVEPPADA
ncbi:MAG: DedA family protein [Planctomycetota bacterium]|nr:DedA family protein [Planctomycetota bacterium]